MAGRGGGKQRWRSAAATIEICQTPLKWSVQPEIENCFSFCCNLGQIEHFPRARSPKQMIFEIYSLLNISIYSDQPGYCRFNAVSVFICVPPCPSLSVVHVMSPGVISPLNRSKHFLGSYFPQWASKQWLILLCSGFYPTCSVCFAFFVANCERKRWRAL